MSTFYYFLNEKKICANVFMNLICTVIIVKRNMAAGINILIIHSELNNYALIIARVLIHSSKL